MFLFEISPRCLVNFEAQTTIPLCQSVSQLVSRLEQTWEAETVLDTHEFHINSENWRSFEGGGQNLPEMPQAAGRGGGQDFFTLVIGGKNFFPTGSWGA